MTTVTIQAKQSVDVDIDVSQIDTLVKENPTEIKTKTLTNALWAKFRKRNEIPPSWFIMSNKGTLTWYTECPGYGHYDGYDEERRVLTVEENRMRSLIIELTNLVGE